MNVLIIEDELPASNRLKRMLEDLDENINVLDAIDSVESSVKWLKNFNAPDLVFMDIQLADGLSFDIFSQVELKTPVIFTTAYDQYTLKAFKVNSVDYLLKPIAKDDLKLAIDKYKQLHNRNGLQQEVLESVLANLNQTQYKKRFLVKKGSEIYYLNTTDIAYIYLSNGITYFVGKEGGKFHSDQNMEQVESSLNPQNFYRINRQIIVHLPAISSIKKHYGNRLILELKPNSTDDEVIVSRDKVADFKIWLDQ